MNTDNLNEIAELANVAEAMYGFRTELNLSAANMAYNQILIVKKGYEPREIMHVMYLDGVFQFATCGDKTVHSLEEMPDMFEHLKSYKYLNE